ncbi:MAG: hypothetical protein KUG76_05285 [Gammaproteobacteria bacterium]|nr:hypothetical protein [Gammaproteobacteria bacterium]
MNRINFFCCVAVLSVASINAKAEISSVNDVELAQIAGQYSLLDPVPYDTFVPPYPFIYVCGYGERTCEVFTRLKLRIYNWKIMKTKMNMY